MVSGNVDIHIIEGVRFIGALTDGFAAGVFSPAGVSTVADSAGAGASTRADSAGDGASDEPVKISFNSNAFARFPSAEIFPLW